MQARYLTMYGWQQNEIGSLFGISASSVKHILLRHGDVGVCVPGKPAGPTYLAHNYVRYRSLSFSLKENNEW